MKALARLLALALALAPVAASAQQGFLNSGELIANSSASRGPAGPSTATAFLDRAFGSTSARLLVRGASNWASTAVSGDLTMSAGGAFTIPNSTITFAKIQNLNGSSLFGNNAGIAAAGTNIGLGATLTFSGVTLQTVAQTGDVTTPANSFATTIANQAVTFAKFQNLTASSLFGNNAGSPGSGTNITLGATLTFSGAALQTLAHTGDVTTPANSFVTTIANNAVTNAKAAQMAAFTFKGNNTGSTANAADVSIPGLATKASPVSGDLVMIADSAASNAWKQTTVGALSSAGSVASVNGQTGALIFYMVPTGRLTLVSVVPVMTSTQSAKTTVYYTSYIGSTIPIFDGTNMVLTEFGTELSQATTDTTKSPAAVAANKNYDIFVWNDGGTIRATRGPAWASDSTRGTGAGTTELSDISVGAVHRGIQLNANAITNGPAAFRGTYVGTIRSNGSSQIDWIFGAAASGGTAASLGVWNAFNRVLVATTVTDSGASYTYTSGTVRQARASAGNQVSAVIGLVEDGASATTMAYNLTTAAAGAAAATGVGLNSTTTYSFQKFIVAAATAAATSGAGASGGTVYPALGWNTISMNENGDGTNANNFNAGSTASLSVLLKM